MVADRSLISVLTFHNVFTFYWDSIIYVIEASATKDEDSKVGFAFPEP
jgi:hypothetical protein